MPARPGSVLERVDHLVYAAPELEATVEALAERLGVRAEPGGRHPAEGTRNFLIALGPAAYLEIVGPDTGTPAPAQPRWFGIDGLGEPRLVGWAANGENLGGIVAAAARAGVILGKVGSGSRERSDGQLLSWCFTDPRVVVEGGVVPLLIDWGVTPHPALSASAGCRLMELRAEHPAPERVQQALRILGLALPVSRGPRPALAALLETPKGIVQLR